MKQTKQFLRPLLMAIVMLVGMLVPKGAWAEDREVWEEETISSDASYDMIYVYPGSELIINKGVTLTVTEGLNIHGTVINYGTIIGEGSINMQGGVLANHGHIDLGYANGNGTFYNTETPGDDYFNLTPTECYHHDYEDLGPVEATCTHGAGTQFKCYTCYYIGIDETGDPLPHDNYDHNGLTVCSTCGQLTFDATPIGEGTAERPYQIANAGHLFWFADKVNNDYENFKEANAVLTADIVVNDGTFADDGTFTATGASEPSTPIEWLIIGRFDIYSLGYRGTFDGQGHTISGLYANYRYSGFVGMSAGEGKIKNVGVINSYFDGNRAGGICGRAFNNTEISNCYSSNVICKGYYVGGIVGGSSSSDVSIINCYSTASLINQSGIDIQAGGIAGEMNGSTTNCYTSYGNVNGWCETEINCEANVTPERFASGEIAYKLNGSIDGDGNWTAGATNGTQAWYQKLGENGNSYPVLAAAEGNTVYEQKTIDCGGTVVACNYYNTEEEDVTQPHAYQVLLDENSNPVFVWSEDYPTATLQVVCSHHAEHTANVEVTGEGITSAVTTPATCTAVGVRTYTATATYEGDTYTGTKEVEISIDPDAHAYQVLLDENSNPVFVWSEGYTTATLQLVCSRDEEHTAGVEVTGEGITSAVTTPATCTTAGVRTYTATATYEGDTYTGTKELEIPATGHSFDEETDPDHTHCTACDHWWTYYTTTGEDIAGIEERVGAVAHYFKEGNGYFETEECFTSVPEGAFFEFDQETYLGLNLKSISLPFVTRVENNAFNNCQSLESVTLPNVTTVGEGAFAMCKALTAISLPEATTIGPDAFSTDIALESISLPKAVTIGNYAFDGCPNLTELTLPCNFDLDRESVGLGENESVTISRVHKGESVIIEGVLATCTEDGYEAYEGCSVCLEPFGEKTVIPALGHKYYNGVCTVCGYKCQHSWENGVCELCDYECQHHYERGEGFEGDNFHVCTICQYDDDCTFKDGICTGCGYVCEHKTGGYKDEHTHLCSACDLSLPHIIDEEHLYYSVYTEDGDCVNIYRGAGGNEISVQNYDELESLKFKVYSLCNVCSDGHTDKKAYPEDFFAEANYNDINCSEASLDVIIYKRVDDGAESVAYYELKVSISNPSHKWENGVCSRCDAECEHDFTNGILTDEPVEDGLYAYACENGCGAHNGVHIIKDFNGIGNRLKLSKDGEGNYCTSSDVILDDGAAFATPVKFTASNVTMARTFTQSVGDAVVPATIMLPFSIEASALATETADGVTGTKFYGFTSLTQNAETGKWEANMDRVTGTVEAYTPYMIVLTEGTAIDFGSTEVTFPATSATLNNTVQGDWTFVATNEKKVWKEDDFANGEVYYGFAAGNETTPEGKFVKVGAGASIDPLRAYIMKTPQTRAAGTLPSIISVRLNETSATGIGTLNTETGEFTFDGWYDLQGRRINEPLKNGISIKNGRKMMKK